MWQKTDVNYSLSSLVLDWSCRRCDWKLPEVIAASKNIH